MSYKDYKTKIIEHKKMLVSMFGNIPNTSGIYIFARNDNGIKYAYVGQAKHLLTRIAEHFLGYQHIDLSIKKHGLYSTDN